MTAMSDAYDAAKAIMVLANAAAPTTLVQAPTNYGTDFRITPGSGLYQVQVSPEFDYHKGTVSHPKAIVVVLVHHFVSSLANEESFLHSSMFQVSERLLDRTFWRAEPGIYDFEPEVEPELSDAEREGNVITFDIAASILMTAI